MVASDLGDSSPSQSAETLLAEAIESKRRFDEFVAASTAEVTQLLDKARADAAEAERLKTEVATLKGNIESTQNAASTELGIVTQAKANAETLNSEAVSLSRAAAEKLDAASGILAEFNTKREAIDPLLTELESVKAISEAKRDSVNTTIGEIEETKAKYIELAGQVGAAHEAISKDQDALKEKIETIGKSHDEILAFRKLLFENTREADSVEAQVSALRDEMAKIVDAARADRSAFTSEAVQLRNDLFASLEKKILALLPSAGAAGLAYTYYDAKSKYSPTSFAGKPGGTELSGWWKFWRSSLSYNPASIVSTISFYTLFLLPLFIVAWGSFQLLHTLETDPRFVLTYQMLGLRLLVAAPLATISGFGFASLRRYQRLYEEYNHKQRVMELYESFKKEIDASGSSEQKKMLLDVMLNSVASKASDFAKNDEKIDESFLTKAERWGGILTKLKGAAS